MLVVIKCKMRICKFIGYKNIKILCNIAFVNSTHNTMAQEIERKFLVVSNQFKQEAGSKTHIIQGYLAMKPEATVRVRIADKQAFLTIKGISINNNTTRYEWEKEIDIEEARELLILCGNQIIEKYRYEVQKGDFTFEVDEFLGDNKGLIVAEIELESENDKFEKPVWLGDEVTQDVSYFNTMLLQKPFAAR